MFDPGSFTFGSVLPGTGFAGTLPAGPGGGGGGGVVGGGGGGVPTTPCLSTVTVKLFEELFPLASVAVHVTFVLPIANVDPESGLQPTVGFGSTVSVADAENVTTAPRELEAPASRLPGAVRTGAVVSRTLTVKLAVDVFPEASVAEHVTGVTRMKKFEPD